MFEVHFLKEGDHLFYLLHTLNFYALCINLPRVEYHQEGGEGRGTWELMMKKYGKASSSDIAHPLHGGCKCVRVIGCVGSGSGLGWW